MLRRPSTAPPPCSSPGNSLISRASIASCISVQDVRNPTPSEEVRAQDPDALLRQFCNSLSALENTATESRPTPTYAFVENPEILDYPQPSPSSSLSSSCSFPSTQLTMNPYTHRPFKPTCSRSNITSFNFLNVFDEDIARAHILEFFKKLLSEQPITKLHSRLADVANVAEEYIALLYDEFGELGSNAIPTWMQSIMTRVDRDPEAAISAISAIVLVQVTTQNNRYGEWYKDRRSRNNADRDPASPHPPRLDNTHAANTNPSPERESFPELKLTLKRSAQTTREGGTASDHPWTPYNSFPRKKARRRPVAQHGGSSLSVLPNPINSPRLLHNKDDHRAGTSEATLTPVTRPFSQQKASPVSGAQSAKTVIAVKSTARQPQPSTQVYFDMKLYLVAEADASTNLRRIVSTVDGFSETAGGKRAAWRLQPGDGG